jgi:hypothetical protein
VAGYSAAIARSAVCGKGGHTFERSF